MSEHTGCKVASALDNKFDGDTGSANFTYENRSRQQARDYLASRVAYVTPAGSLRASPFDYIMKLVARNMTGTVS